MKFSYLISCVVIVLLFIVGPSTTFLGSAFGSTLSSGTTLTASSVAVSPSSVLLSPSFNPKSTEGGVPLCFSKTLGTILCYPPNFLKSAYNFPSGLDGSGSTVVIVDAFGSPTLQSDLDTFSAAFNIPTTSVTILCGPTWTGASTDQCPPFNPNSKIDTLCAAPRWWEETSLDVQMVHGLAPGAKIVLVVSDDCKDKSINAAESAIVSQSAYKGSIMSQSFGEPDNLVGCSDTACTKFNPTIRQTADQIYAMAKSNSWTVIASSGDDGANEALESNNLTVLTPSWPATNPYNLAAGGTMGNPYGGQFGAPPGPGVNVTCAAHTKCNTGLVVINGGSLGCSTAARPGEPSSCSPVSYGGEATWNEYNIFGIGTASGGGISSFYHEPSYQSGVPQSYTTILGATEVANGRLTPDVSFNSAIQGGYLAYLGFLGVWGVFGGTSAASPAWASIVALLNQQNGGSIGYINPAIYALGESSSYHKVFHDITQGNNSDTAGSMGVDGYPAMTGYDLTTGWGTPNVATFITDIIPLCPGSDCGH